MVHSSEGVAGGAGPSTSIVEVKMHAFAAPVRLSMCCMTVLW